MALGKSVVQTSVPVTEGTPTNTAPTEQAKDKVVISNASLRERGDAIYETLDDAAKAALGAKSATLHFKQLLGQASIPQDRVLAKKESVDGYRPIGIRIQCDEAIDVPVIPVTKDMAKKGFGEVTYRKSKPGEILTLSLYEFMALVMRPEYANAIEYKGRPRGLQMVPKSKKFLSGGAKLPTPTVQSDKAGDSPKETMISIDEKGADNRWHIKPEFKEKFGALEVTERSARSVSGKASGADSVARVSLALRAIFKDLK